MIPRHLRALAVAQVLLLLLPPPLLHMLSLWFPLLFLPVLLHLY